MSWRRESIIPRFAYGKNPLDDPLNASWDAVVRQESPTSPDIDPDDVAILRRLHALEAVALPSPSFFGDLEQRLANLYTLPVTSPRAAPWEKAAPQTGIAQPASRRRGASPRTQRLFSLQGALAALAIMMVAGLLVLYQAVPGPSEPPPIPAAVVDKPAIEPIAQFEFAPPMWDMPDATEWDYMETGLLSVAPATSFTTDVPFFISVDGPLSLTVLSGELSITPAGPAFFFPAHQSGQPPAEVTAGKTVVVGPNETIIYAAVDTATGSNPGVEPALTLYGSMGMLVPMVPSEPDGASLIVLEKTHPIPVPTKGATVTLQRLELAPFDTFVFEPDAGLRYLPLIDPAQTDGLRIEEGALEGLVPQPGAQRIAGATQLRYLMPGPHTIFNLGDKTVVIYFLVIEPFPDAATPPA